MRILRNIVIVPIIIRLLITKRKRKVDNLGVAYVVDGFNVGGLEQVVLNLYKGLRQRGIPTYIVSITGDVGLLANELQYPNHLRIINFSTANFIKYCVKNNIGTIHYHHAMFHMRLMRILGFRTCYTIHNTYIWFTNRQWGRLLSNLQFCDYVIAASEWSRQYFLNKTGFKKPVTTILNGIEVSKLVGGPNPEMSRGNFGLSGKDKVFVNVASFTAGKYQAALVGAMSRIVAARKDIKILLVGNVLDKRYHKYVNDKIRQLNLGEYIKHIDYMEQSKLGDFLYNIPNAFILSSIHEVGVPLVAMEAIINDLPVIMPDFGVSSSFPIAENITTIPLLCDDIIDMDSGKVNKLSRKIHAPNENGLVAAMVYVADNTKVNHPKVKLRYDVLSIDTMVEKHIKLLELGDAKSER